MPPPSSNPGKGKGKGGQFNPNWSHPLNRGLVLWLPIVPNQLTYGTNRWFDIAGGHHATLNNFNHPADWTTGRYDSSVEADYRGGTLRWNSGTGRYCRVSHHPLLDFETATDGFSIEIWVWWNGVTFPNSAFILSQTNDPTAYDGWAVAPTDFTSANRCALHVNGGAGAARADASIGGASENGMKHILATWDGSTAYIYVDGGTTQASGAYAVVPNTGAQDIIIGGYYADGLDDAGNPDFLFNEPMGGIRMWRRHLNEREVSLAYEDARQGYPGTLLPSPSFAVSESPADAGGGGTGDEYTRVDGGGGRALRQARTGININYPQSSLL